MSDNLFLPKEVLIGYGCKNCVWKVYDQCPHGYTTPEEGIPEGYCKELVDFIFNLAEGNDSINNIKEKFFLYIQEMQSMGDYTEYNKLKQKRDRYVADGEYGKANSIEASMQSYKLWWSRLTENVTKGYSKINDRAERSKQEVNVNHKISLTQIHKLAGKVKQVEDKSED